MWEEGEKYFNTLYIANRTDFERKGNKTKQENVEKQKSNAKRRNKSLAKYLKVWVNITQDEDRTKLSKNDGDEMFFL